MTEPAPTGHGATFDLGAVDREMRQEAAYLREGHTARTLVREPDLRVVLVVMKAGARIAEHHADETASVHALSGHIRLRLPDKGARPEWRGCSVNDRHLGGSERGAARCRGTRPDSADGPGVRAAPRERCRGSSQRS